ncbi:hypothetical protein GCM10011380_14120 [Sphingomonas metalli]|uniref:TIGR02117 family protein n=1 Tax=Sphingomonas metalli TaxID=1779358 RepID=A0A916T1E7_9SPHN|nr:TIGR02117 family protein [Sphingomonas metalli]GGB25727.1 hypothetical protein GCM10011380_14120 [Sphingomonas metalli]
MLRLWLRRLALLLVGVPFAYLVAGAVGGAIPVRADRRAPATGVTVYIESNGIHTGIIVPKVAAGIDWRSVARAEHLRNPRYAAYDHLAFGWGDRAFYLGTPTWADVRPATVLAAAIGSDATLVHVDHLPRPAPAADVRAVVLRTEEYRRLSAFIAASLKPGGARHPGYGPYDAFYEGRGHYDALHTCNEWTGAALRHAGVTMGRWTPFPATVMQWL